MSTYRETDDYSGDTVLEVEADYGTITFSVLGVDHGEGHSVTLKSGRAIELAKMILKEYWL